MFLPVVQDNNIIAKLRVITSLYETNATRTDLILFVLIRLS